MKLQAVFLVASVLAEKCSYISARIETDLSEVGIIKNQTLFFYVGKVETPIVNGSVNVDGTTLYIHAQINNTSRVVEDNTGWVPKYDLDLYFKNGSEGKAHTLEYGYAYRKELIYDIYNDKELCF